MAAIDAYIQSLQQPGAAPPAGIPLPVPAPAEAPPVAQPGFLDNMSDPTGNSAMLLDLAARLSRAPQPGQSGFSATLGSTSEALQGQTSRKASKAATELSTREKELAMATEQRTLDSADIRDDLVTSKTRLNDRLPAGGQGSSSVQDIQLRARTLLANFPETYKDLNEATEAAFRLKDSKDGYPRVIADAKAKFVTENEFVLSEAEMAAGLERLELGFAEFKEIPDPVKNSPRQKVEIPGVTAPALDPSGKAMPTPDQFAAMDKKAFGDYIRSVNPDIPNDLIAQAYAETRGKDLPKSSKPKVKAKAKPKKALTPEQRQKRRVGRAADVKTSRAAGKANQATVQAERKEQRKEVKKYLKSGGFKDLSKAEMKAYLKRNKDDMTPNDYRTYGGIMRKKVRVY